MWQPHNGRRQPQTSVRQPVETLRKQLPTSCVSRVSVRLHVCVCVLYNEYICNICFHFIHLKCCVTFHNVAAAVAVAEAATATATVTRRVQLFLD